jgi:TetR/AcrR family transcriptional regulator, transcriptional repressor of bet genes
MTLDNRNQPRVPIEDIRRVELISATLRIMSAQGFDRATVRDIARAAGASVGSVNYYFKSKDDLLHAAVAETDARFRSHVRDALAETSGYAEKLGRVVELCFPDDELEGPDWGVFVDLWHQAARLESYRAIFEEANVEWVELLSGVLADGAEEGTFTLTGTPRDEAVAFAAMIDGLALYTRVTQHVDTAIAQRIAKQHIARLCGTAA